MERAQAQAAIEKIDEESRTVTLSFVSEQPVKRYFGQEVLQVDEKSMVLDRFNNGLGCLLFNHKSDKVLGKILKTWQENNKGYAEVQFDEGEEEERIFNKVKNKTLCGTSVSYNPLVWEKVEAGQKSTSGRVSGPAYVATRWEPLEISIVSVPADASVGVGRSFEEQDKGDEMPENEQRDLEEENNMGENDKNSEKERETAPDQTETKEAAQRAIEEERSRSREIRQLCREFEVDEAPYIDEGKSVEEVRAAILDKLKKEREAQPTARRIEFGEDEKEKFARAATDGILLLTGMTLDKPADGARDFMNYGFRDLMIECVERAGESGARKMDMDTLIQRSSGMGIGSLGGILSNVANKSLSEVYKGTPTTFERWTGEGSVDNFKEAAIYTLSEAGNLEKINEKGEFKNDVIKEAEVKRKIFTYGKKFSLTRQMIINDDLGALARIPQKYAIAARRGINKLVYSTLTESLAFTAKNGNLAENAGAPNVQNIGEGRKAMRLQKNIKGEETLNIRPKYIIVPAELETATEQFIYSITDPSVANANVKNPFANKLEIVCDGELDALLKNIPSWWLAASAAEAETIQVDYLRGRKVPTIRTRESWDILGQEWEIFFDYGVTMLDHKGLFKNNGK